MTASELAFLGLGLLFGAAAGAAFLAVLGTRPPRRDIRVTVTRDAVPRRSETLSYDAFLARPAQPAPGGPGDRRWFDRRDSRLDPGGYRPDTGSGGWASATGAAGPASRSPIPSPDRTIVPSAAHAVAVAIRSEAYPGLGNRYGRSATAMGGSALERMLRGEHRAMVEVVDRVAGAGGLRRREWELLLGGLVEAMADMAVRESVIDFPMGTAFWDTFTVEQCRRIVSALAARGYCYDGRAGWADHHVPAYRDLTNAVAEIGVEPRHMRGWPSHAEIATLFMGARPAPEELLAAAGPSYAAEDMQILLGDRASELANLWAAWEAVRPVLFDDGPPSDLPIES